VSVIVPAYNAARTIDATLDSIRNQTYRELEIIVVDDGSCDDTAVMVERQQCLDPRIRLFRQKNAGVAAARNRGIAEACGDFIAPIDADDLWRPTKIERQMELMIARGAAVGLVYTWVATVDCEGDIISTAYRPGHEGPVLAQICRGNFLGTGSSALMRGQVVHDLGGYDPAPDIQGCADLELYFRIAEHHHFAVVREHLTGYRIGAPDSMSSNGERMLRAYDKVMSGFRAAYPEHAREFHDGRNEWLRRLVTSAWKTGQVRSALALMLSLCESDIRFAVRSCAWMLWSALVLPIRRMADRRPRERFVVGSAPPRGGAG
jgi:glycosyltransferase involved in cell wall biosynthesis